jgi:hypothetical protein
MHIPSISRLRRSAVALLAAVLAAFVLSACGASAAHSTAQREAVVRQLSAQFLFDAYTGSAETCKLMTARYLAEMGATDGKSGCTAAYNRLDGWLLFEFKWNGGTLRTLRERVEAALAHATAHLTASEAVVSVPNETKRFGADNTVVTLQKTDAAWKVAGLTEGTPQPPTDPAVSRLEQQEYKAAKVALDNATLETGHRLLAPTGHRLLTAIAKSEPALASLLSADVAPARAQAKPGVIYLGSITATKFIIVAYTRSGDRVELQLGTTQFKFNVTRS